MSNQKIHRYKRWYDALRTPLTTRQVAEIARQHGAKVIRAFKPGWSVWGVMSFAARPDQMREVDQAWKLQNITIYNRRPKGAFDVSTDIPPQHWEEHALGPAN